MDVWHKKLVRFSHAICPKSQSSHSFMQMQWLWDQQHESYLFASFLHNVMEKRLEHLYVKKQPHWQHANVRVFLDRHINSLSLTEMFMAPNIHTKHLSWCEQDFNHRKLCFDDETCFFFTITSMWKEMLLITQSHIVFLKNEIHNSNFIMQQHIVACKNVHVARCMKNCLNISCWVFLN